MERAWRVPVRRRHLLRWSSPDVVALLNISTAGAVARSRRPSVPPRSACCPYRWASDGEREGLGQWQHDLCTSSPSPRLTSPSAAGGCGASRAGGGSSTLCHHVASGAEGANVMPLSGGGVSIGSREGRCGGCPGASASCHPGQAPSAAPSLA
jgi:hypothetical protein